MASNLPEAKASCPSCQVAGQAPPWLAAYSSQGECSSLMLVFKVLRMAAEVRSNTEASFTSMPNRAWSAEVPDFQACQPWANSAPAVFASWLT